MAQTEIVEKFFSMEKKLRELSGELIAKGMTVEEIKKATEKDIKDFSDFAYNNSDVIYNVIKENLIERLKNDAIKPIDALFIYLMVINFTPINSLQSDHLNHSVTKINDQVLVNSKESNKDLQEPIREELKDIVNKYDCPKLNNRSKAEEQALKVYPRTDDAWGDEWQKRVGFVKGYNQAQQDLMSKAKQWFTQYTNIPYKVKTNENGEPLADSYIQYAKTRLDAANEMFENFKQFIMEN